jgi:hypothetical protein
LFYKVDLILPIQGVFEIVFSKLQDILLGKLLLLHGINLRSFLGLLPFLGILVLIRENTGIFLILRSELAFNMYRASSLAQESQVDIFLLELILLFAAVVYDSSRG